MDEQGNRIIVIKEDNILKLYIALKSENRRRSVGFINTNTKVLHITRCRPRHLFRKLNAYGFSYQIIKDAKKFNKIRLKDEKAEWLIPTSFILDKNNSDFLHFKGNGGFELQVFLPLDKIEQFKRPERF
jgi:hypothetical protein